MGTGASVEPLGPTVRHRPFFMTAAELLEPLPLNAIPSGMHVKHDKKGELPVRKYKTKRKLAQAEGLHYASFVQVQVQDQYLGTTYIGYAYYDDFGDEYIYWYPYDMILDGDTGAIEYVAAY